VALVSPWDWATTDAFGKVLSVHITFDNITFTILAAVTHKDPGCQYNVFYFGTGPDGTPDSATSKMTLPDGDAVVAVLLLNGFGFTTIEQATAVQATAGP
jgi:hypothetical protein